MCCERACVVVLICHVIHCLVSRSLLNRCGSPLIPFIKFTILEGRVYVYLCDVVNLIHKYSV